MSLDSVPVDYFDRICADLGLEPNDLPGLGVAELLDRHRDWQRWQDFLEELRAVIGWPAVVRYDHARYVVEVLVDGQVVGGMGDDERQRARSGIAGVILGMRVRRSWWGQLPPDPELAGVVDFTTAAARIRGRRPKGTRS